jgi:hypothetical protein
MIITIIVGFILAEGLILGIVAYFLYARKKAKLSHCLQTQGVVIDLKQHGSDEGGPTIHPVIMFRAQNGADVTFESTFGSSSCKIKKGDSVNILVNQTNPNDSEVVNFMAQWGVPLTLAVASAGSLVLAPLAYLFLKD